MKQGKRQRKSAKTFQGLIVWQEAYQFVLNVYRITKEFPKEEIYGLTSQFRRAAIFIAASIAEGFRKKGNPDKYRFMNIAQGSLEECRYYVILAGDLGYFEKKESTGQLEEISKLLDSYSKALLHTDS